MTLPKGLVRVLGLGIISAGYVILSTRWTQAYIPGPEGTAQWETLDLQSLRVPNVNINPNETFSACLLVMDENIRLREWLAYHYHVLPLRHLIVAIDPRSQRSPAPIFDMFRQVLGMNIIEWTSDANFSFDPNFPEGPIPNHRKQHYKPTARGQYLGRQRTFLEKCIQHFHYQGHHWTACLDPDEYVAIENEGAGANTFYNLTGRDDLRQQGSVLDYIDKARARGNLSNSNCFSVPRLTFGAMETKRATDKSLVSHRLKKLDLYRLDTFRWRQHFNSSHDKMNGLAKPLVDVSSLAEFMPFQVRNPHRLHTQVCGSPFPAWTRGKFGFRANHYLGSWEAYSYRHSDPRKGGEKSREAWEYRAGANDKFDDLSYKWLDGFIDSVGLEVAEFLLKDTGIPRGYRNKNHTDWTMDITRYEIATRLNHHAKLLAHTEQKKREEELRKQSKNPLRRWGLIK